MNKKVLVIEVSNATDEQIQRDLGQAFVDFCEKNEGAGITGNALTEEAGRQVIKFINQGDL